MTQVQRYWCVVLASALLSVMGIVIAAYHMPAKGGSGGALAVALAFAVLFLKRDYGVRAQALLIRNLPDEITGLTPDECIQHLQQRIDAINVRLNLDSDGQRIQNIALAWASCIGTLAWGFGDSIAAWLCRFLGHQHCF